MVTALRLLFQTGMMMGLILISTPMLAGSNAGSPMADQPKPNEWKALLAQADDMGLKGHYPYMDCFRAAAKKYDLPLVLLVAVARGESNFDPHAKSSRDCFGIMQIKWPGTANDLGIVRKKDLFDPCINIDAGARYLSWLLNKFGGNVHLAVAAYNYGPNAIRIDHIPDGAKWYAAYIRRHLMALLSTSHENTKRILIVGFTFYHNAKDFVLYLQGKVQRIPFEIFRSPNYTYDVYVTYKTVAEQKDHLLRLKNVTGIEPLRRERT